MLGVSKRGLADTTGPEGIEGMSVVPALLGAEQSPHESLYWETYDGPYSQALRMGDWKLLRLNYGSKLELYDLAIDPGETTNVAAQYPQVLAQLTAAMDAEHTPSDLYREERPRRRIGRRRIAGAALAIVLLAGAILYRRLRRG